MKHLLTILILFTGPFAFSASRPISVGDSDQDIYQRLLGEGEEVYCANAFGNVTLRKGVFTAFGKQLINPVLKSNKQLALSISDNSGNYHEWRRVVFYMEASVVADNQEKIDVVEFVCNSDITLRSWK